MKPKRKPRTWKRWAVVNEDGSELVFVYLLRSSAEYNVARTYGERVQRIAVTEILPKKRKKAKRGGP